MRFLYFQHCLLPSSPTFFYIYFYFDPNSSSALFSSSIPILITFRIYSFKYVYNLYIEVEEILYYISSLCCCFCFFLSSLRIKTKTKEDEQVKEKFKLFRCLYLLDGRSKVFSCFSFCWQEFFFFFYKNVKKSLFLGDLITSFIIYTFSWL